MERAGGAAYFCFSVFELLLSLGDDGGVSFSVVGERGGIAPPLSSSEDKLVAGEMLFGVIIPRLSTAIS